MLLSPMQTMTDDVPAAKPAAVTWRCLRIMTEARSSCQLVLL